jgi:hypothetical protein
LTSVARRFTITLEGDLHTRAAPEDPGGTAMASSLHQPQPAPVGAASQPQSGGAPSPRPAGSRTRDIRDETATHLVQTALDLLALPV